MELTENMEEFLNDLIGKRMEQVYQEKYPKMMMDEISYLLTKHYL